MIINIACNKHTILYNQEWHREKRNKKCGVIQMPFYKNSVQFSSVAQSCLTVCDPTDCSTSGFPVHHHLPGLTQTHVHWVDGVSQPSCPLSFHSTPAFNLSQHQGLFKWVSYGQNIGASVSASNQETDFL